MSDDGFQPAPPYRLIDNENSLLDVSDLVFVDAVSTGYSRTVAGVSSTPYHGQQGDIQAFGNVINEYLKTYSRWPSPKFLIGESYGTIRSAGLSQELQTRHGIELNGIVLVSALLTYMDMTEALRSTMARNPFLRVFVAAGYYDMATPLLGIEMNMWHLAYDPVYTQRVQFGYYEGGHMMYIRPSAHKAVKADIARFIAGASGRPRAATEH